MNSMRKVFFLSMAIVLAAFALPATALDKQFNITVTPAPPTPYILAAGQTTTVSVKFTNLSTGNSNISSLILTLANVTVNNTASPPAGTVTFGTPTFSPSGSVVACPSGTPAGSICVSNITNGVKPGNSLTVTVAVTPNAPFICADTAWIGQAFAGSSFGNQVFSDPATQATNSQVGVFVGCDVLACDGQFTSPQNLQSDDPGYAQVYRSMFNKDGATDAGCTVVPYSFANTILNDDQNKNKVNLVWYTQATAVFILSTNSQLRTVGSGNWTDAKRPVVAWLPATTTLGGSQVEIAGPACLATNPLSAPVPNLPGPYGTLASAITTTGLITSIAVNNVPASPTGGWAPLPTSAPPPFPIVIGGERFQVTGVMPTGSGAYTLTLDTGLGAGGRGVGGTSITSHPLGALVNSSPLPLLVGYSFDSNQTAAGYFNGMQAQICIQDYGWAASDIDPVSGAAQVFDFSTAIATGDLTVRYP